MATGRGAGWRSVRRLGRPVEGIPGASPRPHHHRSTRFPSESRQSGRERLTRASSQEEDPNLCRGLDWTCREEEGEGGRHDADGAPRHILPRPAPPRPAGKPPAAGPPPRRAARGELEVGTLEALRAMVLTLATPATPAAPAAQAAAGRPDPQAPGLRGAPQGHAGHRQGAPRPPSPPRPRGGGRGRLGLGAPDHPPPPGRTPEHSSSSAPGGQRGGPGVPAGWTPGPLWHPPLPAPPAPRTPSLPAGPAGIQVLPAAACSGGPALQPGRVPPAGRAPFPGGPGGPRRPRWPRWGRWGRGRGLPTGSPRHPPGLSAGSRRRRRRTTPAPFIGGPPRAPRGAAGRAGGTLRGPLDPFPPPHSRSPRPGEPPASSWGRFGRGRPSR